MRPSLRFPLVAFAAAALLAGCGGDVAPEATNEQPTVDDASSAAEEPAVDGLDFTAIEEMTPEAGFVGDDEFEDGCVIAYWSENDTGVHPEEMRKDSTFFRQLDCYPDESGFPELIQVGIYAEFVDGETATAYVEHGLNARNMEVFVADEKVFMIRTDFDPALTESAQQLCDCQVAVK